MGDEASLPENDDDLENAFTYQNYLDVEVDDSTRVEQCATDEYSIFVFKDKNSNNTDGISVLWNGQSDLAPSSSVVKLQIWNRTDQEWADVDEDNETAANTDFNLQGTISSDLDKYYDANYWVAFRVYQEAT